VKSVAKDFRFGIAGLLQNRSTKSQKHVVSRVALSETKGLYLSKETLTCTCSTVQVSLCSHRPDAFRESDKIGLCYSHSMLLMGDGQGMIFPYNFSLKIHFLFHKQAFLFKKVKLCYIKTTKRDKQLL
jgi:hypothetical protein